MSMYVVVTILSILLVVSVIGNIYQRSNFLAQRRRLQVFDPAMTWVGFSSDTSNDWMSRYTNADGRTFSRNGYFKSAPGVIMKIDKDLYVDEGYTQA